MARTAIIETALIKTVWLYGAYVDVAKRQKLDISTLLSHC
jgi:hypothetical protein